MKDAVNRFRYMGSPETQRLPGPKTPFQDEPQDPESISVPRNAKSVLVPEIQSMEDYILKHHKRMILNALTRNAGALADLLSIQSPEQSFKLTPANTSFEKMYFWRVDQYTLLVDVIVKTTAFSGESGKHHLLWQELKVNMRYGMEFSAGECSTAKMLPHRDYWELTRYLIPILSKEKIEKGTEELLRRYSPESLSSMGEHNAFRLAHRMGLEVRFLPLVETKRTLSMVFFCSGTVQVQDLYDELEDEPPLPYDVTVPGKTIVINIRAVHKDRCQMEIYHECIHYDWHFMFYRLQDMHNTDLQKLRMKRIIVKDPKKNPNPLLWMEWQANRGGFGLMMPLSMIRPEVTKRWDGLSKSSFHAGEKLDSIGRGIAFDYDLPKFRVRARMIQMGNIEARGSLNYVDDHYIRPFAFEREKGSGNNTFVLTREDMFEEYAANEKFRNMIDSGKYVYADGHLCINDIRFVRETESGLDLTDWANAHVDECCLRFISVYEAAGVSEYRFGCLNSDEEYNRHYVSIAAENLELSDIRAFDKMNELLTGMPDAFPEAFAYLMERRHVTVEKMEEITGLSVSTISRLRREEKSNYAVDQVMAICIGLHLPPVVSRELFLRAGIVFRATRQHMAYQMILDCMYMDSLTEVQGLLERLGCKPLKLKAS